MSLELFKSVAQIGQLVSQTSTVGLRLGQLGSQHVDLVRLVSFNLKQYAYLVFHFIPESLHLLQVMLA